MSINFISLLAFIIVLGVVVDDAIVVGESVHTYQEQSRSGRKLRGRDPRAPRRVLVPVTFGGAHHRWWPLLPCSSCPAPWAG